MIKQLFLFINIISIFFYQLFFTSDVTVKQLVPETIAPNSSVTITITITIAKADISGFAKLQQTIPNGFVVELIESKGATFSFKDQIMKFIWMSLPMDKEFTISYKLKNISNNKGTFSLDGRFSYLAENERKNIDIPTANFSISEDIASNDNSSETENDEQTADLENVDSENIQKEFKVDRQVEKITENKFKVTLSFTKKNIDGFAKLTETIPNDFTATQDKSQGAVFSVENNLVKLLWLSVPVEDDFSVSYFVETKTANGEQAISGVLSYLDNEQTKKQNIASTTFEVNLTENQLAENNNTSNNEENVVDNKEQTLQEKIDNSTSSTNDEQAEEKPKEEKTEVSKITNTPQPETTVAYKVQVGAFRENISVDKFKKKFKLSDKIELENHEGWSKLTAGSFNEYKAARDKRNILRNNVKTAFVSAYNKGNRITVQEALMISNQKWVN